MRASVLAVWTDQPAPACLLTAVERAQLSVLAGSERRRQWLTSRHALRVLLGLFGLPRDTAACGFPIPGCLWRTSAPPIPLTGGPVCPSPSSASSSESARR
jgi:hypothetical protein